MGITLDSLVVLLCTIVLICILYHIVITMEEGKVKRPLVILYLIVILYCIADLIWSLTVFGTIPRSKLLMSILTYTDYVMESAVAFVWFRYTERYLVIKRATSKVVLVLDGILMYAIDAMLVANLWTGIVFSVDESGELIPGEYRIVVYLLHIVYFLASAVIALVKAIREQDSKKRRRCRNAVVFSILPIIAGVFQYYNRYMPLYVMGYMVVCVLIYLFNITPEREQVIRESHRSIVREQKAVIEALTSDYVFVARYNIDKQEVTVYRDSGLVIPVNHPKAEEKEVKKIDARKMGVFYNHLVDTRVCASDREMVRRAFAEDVIMKELAKSDAYFVNCRLDEDGILAYYQTKIIRDTADKSSNAIIVGLHSIDEEMQKERIQQERLEEACTEAEAANHAKSDFLSRMSHDIRTPINGVIGMIEILKKNHDDRQQVEDGIKKIEDASQHLLALVNDVLDMSRIESNKLEIASNPINLKDVAETCASIIKGQLTDRSIDFVTDYNGVLHRYLLGDAIHLRQVFINILGNAVKFTPDGGRIDFIIKELGVSNMQASFRFIIADTGIGMSEDFLSHIWDRFSQENLADARTHYQGTGLGMSITKSFIDAMDGTIAVESELGKGTTFTIDITLPIDKNPVLPKGQEKKVDLRGARILVAEDNELNREIAETILEELGMVVSSAEDGKEALECFEKSEEGFFQAILMDIRMPNMDGLEATAAIRALDRSDAKSVPIIAMTANAFEEDKQKSLEAGMNEHLNKPMEVTKLVEALERFVQR